MTFLVPGSFNRRVSQASCGTDTDSPCSDEPLGIVEALVLGAAAVGAWTSDLIERDVHLVFEQRLQAISVKHLGSS